jgi:protein O-mannosyl-transferase
MTSKRRKTTSRRERRSTPLPLPPEDPKRRWQPLLLPLLALLPLATFWPVLRNEFITLDDDAYVSSNVSIRGGLTWAGVRWAFTTGHEANWHPLTWLSHMADVSLFGLNPAGHHATSLVLHVVNTLLLFVVFRSLTKDSVRSAWVAALFAVHPAHVESVAWVAERKDVLSTAFWLATMWAYGSWVRKRGVGRYAVVLLFFAAGLMAKPMLVSLPLVLLLIDYWPLGRFGEVKEGRTPAALVFEKAPLFLLAAASGVVTLLVQRAGGAVGTLEKFPLWARAGNALVAYVRYLKMLFWPVDLAVVYPHPGTSLSGGEVLGAGLLLVALSVAVVALRRKAPYLFVGWFWFLVTLLPVIGLVQVGVQSMADRYTYVPFIGLFVAMAWGVPAVARHWRYVRVAVPAAAVAVLIASAAAAAVQVRLWKNTETLFVHALRTTKNNFVVENNLGDYLSNAGRAADALPHITEALRLRPNSFEANVNMGRSLVVLDRLDESIPYFSRAVRIDPHNGVALNNLARARFLQGEVAEAIPLYEAAVVAAPGLAEPRRRLAVVYLMEERIAAALSELESAVRLDPSGEEWRLLLEGVRALERNPDDPAVAQLRRYLAAAYRDAGLALQRRGKKEEARVQLQKALELVTPSPQGTPGSR